MWQIWGSSLKLHRESGHYPIAAVMHD